MLKGITKGGTKKPPRIVLYGEKKIGKSSFGSEAPKPIFVTTEDGVDNIDVDQYPVPKSWEGLLANISAIAEGSHDYKTMVIDTLGGAVDLAALYVCTTQFGGDFGAKGFGSFAKGWAATSEEMRRLLPTLDTCRNKGMTVLLLAHTGIQNVKNPIDGDYQKFSPDMDKRIWSRFAAWSDIILRADYEHSITEKEGSKKVVSTDTRIIYAAGSMAADAGTRVGYDLPESFPLSWQSFASALGKPNGIEEELKSRWDVLTGDEQKKTLNYLAIKSLDELNQAQSQKVKIIINKLKNKEIRS